MKNLLKVTGILLLTVLQLFLFSSCSRSDDPADNDFLPEHTGKCFLQK